MATVTVEAEIELDDFDTEDLQRELRRRGEMGVGMPDGYDPVEGKRTAELAEACFEARRNGNDARALELIDRLIYAALGRII